MRNVFSSLLYMPVALICLINNSQAAVFHALGDIQRAAENHVLSQLPPDHLLHHVKADRLDERLHLAACSAALQPSLPNGATLGAKTTVAVHCPATGGWTVYVPVAIETEIPALVLTRSIARGSGFGATDVEARPQKIAGLGTVVISDVRELQGLHAKRDLGTGTILLPGMLEPDTLIKRGQQVTLLASIGGLEVRSVGIALSDGSANARIRVRNLNSAKVVEGLVDSDSQVRVQL